MPMAGKSVWPENRGGGGVGGDVWSAHMGMWNRSGEKVKENRTGKVLVYKDKRHLLQRKVHTFTGTSAVEIGKPEYSYKDFIKHQR